MLKQTYIVYGASANGMLAEQILKNRFGCEVLCFCDRDKSKHDLLLDGIVIKSIKELEGVVTHSEKCCFIITNKKYEEVIDELQFIFDEADIRVFDRKKLNQEEDVGFNDIFIEVDSSKPVLNYVECHISYHCNLKCKGCSHFSNIAEPEFPNFEQFQNDMQRLGELFRNIEKIRLLGGEPLLNPELPKYIECCRKIFPLCDMRVVTNGLLIPTVSQSGGGA